MKFCNRLYVLVTGGILLLTIFVAYKYFAEHASCQFSRDINNLQKNVHNHIDVVSDVMDHASVGLADFQVPITRDYSVPGFPLETKTNILNLTTIQEVINESQNIHFRLFNHLIGQYPYVILTDIAIHENKGDAAIGVGETILVNRMKKKVIFYCSSHKCVPDALEKARKKALQYGREKVAVLCQGGGNIMSYAQFDEIRSNIFKAFSDFKVVVFPQSIWPRHQPTTTKFEAIYAKYPNVTFLIRDKQSLGRAFKHLSKNNLILSPDIAFQLGTVPRSFRPQYDVLWIKRADGERSPYSYKNLNYFGMTVKSGDWLSWMPTKDGNTMEKMNLITEMGFIFLQRGRVVITDRLHGHILSTLLHIPHVLLDTSDNKLAAYHNTWTRGLEGHSILTASSPQDALDKAYQLLQKFNDTIPKIVSVMDINDGQF